jgi:hypothetical protein
MCKKMRENDLWIRRTTPQLDEAVSHGYCPQCAEDAFDQIRRWVYEEPNRPAYAVSASRGG